MVHKLAVEEESDAKGYKKVHVAGCRHLIDPNPVEADDLDDLLSNIVGYAVLNDDEVGPEQDMKDLIEALAPCAVKVMMPTKAAAK